MAKVARAWTIVAAKPVEFRYECFAVLRLVVNRVERKNFQVGGSNV
jgi:hypothetical protein